MWSLPIILILFALSVWFLKLAVREHREGDIDISTLTNYITAGISCAAGGVLLLLRFFGFFGG